MIGELNIHLNMDEILSRGVACLGFVESVCFEILSSSLDPIKQGLQRAQRSMVLVDNMGTMDWQSDSPD
jgi:hypothetical protein